MAAVPLRVLIVEDSEDDMNLLLRELRRGGYDVTMKRVDTAEGVQQALADDTWDVVLSDYSMPSFSALAALKLVQQVDPDLPFIIVSGTVGEEVAVTAMKAGAHDFFAKDRLILLVPAIQRELYDAEHRRQRRWAEARWQESEERFVKAFQGSPVGITITAPDGRLIDVNEHFLRISGYTREEVLGYTPLELGLWADPDERADADMLMQTQGYIRDMEMRGRSKSGRIHDILLSVDRMMIGGELCVLSIFNDITLRKRTERELRALYNATSYLLQADSMQAMAEQIVEAVVNEFEHIDCGLMLVDREQNRMVRLARSGRYKADPSHILTLDGLGLVPECVRTRRIIYVPDVIGHPGYVPSDVRTRSELVVPLLAKDEVIAVLDLQSPEVDSFTEGDQRVLATYAERAASALENMSLYEALNRYAVELEWRVAQRTAELQRAKDQVEAVLASTNDPIIMADADDRILQTNPAFNRAFMYEEDDLFRRSLTTLLDEASAGPFMMTFQQVVTTHQPTHLDVTCVRKDGSLFEAEFALAPLIDPDKPDAGVICSVRNITMRKRAEASLQSALMHERELNELKSKFVSMVSHEFRTPLAVIQSSSDLLMRYNDRLSDEQKEGHLAKIQTHILQLTRMLDEIMSLSRAQNIRLELNRQPVDLVAFCRDLRDQYVQLADQHPLTMRVEGTSSTPAQIDVKLMGQAVGNLLSNAIKYSPENTPIELVLDFDTQPGRARISVHDHGIGVPLEDHPRLFDVFHRARNVGAISGTGLGLAIVKQSVEAHGGSVSFTSVPGSGSVFTIELPLLGSPAPEGGSSA